MLSVAGCSLKPIRNFSGGWGRSFWFGGRLLGRCQRRHRYVLGVETVGFGVATFGHGGVVCMYVCMCNVAVSKEKISEGATIASWNEENIYRYSCTL